MNYKSLSKKTSYALRHVPWEYELELDDEGWINIEELLSAFQSEKIEWKNLSENDLIEMMKQSSKQRFELKSGKIRALYGHSTPNKLSKQRAEPPVILYHGTSPEIAELVCKDELKPMRRHYVHLSTDTETAIQVASRKSSHPKLLIISANEAYHDGVNFYVGNEHVWLADNIPSKYFNLAEKTSGLNKNC
jgi:putative RNA 2'-phosphotransferase